MRLAVAAALFASLPAAAQKFDVASVRPSAPGTRGILYHLPGDRLRVQGFTLLNLVSYAWDMPDAQIEGLPKWASSDKFDIEAVPESAPGVPSKELESPRKKAMVRDLLTTRFHLITRREERDQPTYSLVVSKDGPKFSRNTGAAYHIYRTKNAVDFQKVTMPVLAKFLSSTLRPDVGRMVFDETGLSGEFDFRITWAPLRAAAAETDLPSIFGAIEQLGLKLQPDHAPVEFLIVEHADPPEAN